MNTTRKEKAEKALEILQKLDIYEPYIEGFRDKGKVCFFEDFGGYWVDQEPEIEAKMHEIENRLNCLVYAVTHEYMEFGELYDFLIVTDYKEEWDTLVHGEKQQCVAFAYVWNKDCEWCSEFGTVGIQSAFGGIRRIS